MIEAHKTAIATLPTNLALRLFQRLYEEDLVPSLVGTVENLAPALADMVEDLTQAQIVLTLASCTDEEAIQVVEHLVAKPIYMCARGETGEPLTDILGRPLDLPVGHRRSDPAPSPGTTTPALRKRTISATHKRDTRVIVFKTDTNPKRAGSLAAEEFDKYQVGLTLDAVGLLGVRRDTVRWDLHKGYIRAEMLT